MLHAALIEPTMLIITYHDQESNTEVRCTVIVQYTELKLI